MREQRTFTAIFQRTGTILGALLVAMAVRPAAAEDLFRFADEASLADSMAKMDEALAYDGAPADPCRLDILSDPRGHQIFDERTSDAMHRALAQAIVGSDRIDGCTVESHDVGQDEISGFLSERREAGELGQTLALSYYKLGDGVTVFATLRGADGALLGSTGRFDLPVSPEGVGGSEGTDAAAKTDSPVEPAREPRLEQDVAGATPEPADEVKLSEAALRRQLAAETQIVTAPDRPFNLRRIQAGVPPSIRTLRIVDAGGGANGLVDDLADGFVETLEASSGSTAALFDLETADANAAFEQILDNRRDVVVTREPIPPTDADDFTETYGVNMRSRYAEHVVAIAKNEAGSLACGIRYPEDGMFMSTEDHPASERVYFYVNPSIPNAIRDRFVDFALSEQGQALVADHAIDLRLRLSDAGYASWRYQATGEQEAELADLRERFRSLIRTSQRVSSTFRFDFASSDLVLDSRSEQDLENLIDLIKANDIDSRRILLFGFADSSGAAPFNADLSRGRADAVATRLRLAGIPVPPRNVHGIGEDLPVACNVRGDGERDELGARKNRRVEVWIES